MSAGSKEELQSLYFEFGDALAQKGQLADAADSYALAMYYAKRGGNSALADLCREQILVCHPNHVVIRENNAPLFYAQLLMRYPADESKAQLERIKQELAAKPAVTPHTLTSINESMTMAASSTVMADFEPAPIPMTTPAMPTPTPPPITPVSPLSAMSPGMDGVSARPSTYPGPTSGVGTMDYPGGPSSTIGGGRGDLASLFGPSTNAKAWSESISLPPAEPARASTKPTLASVGHSGFEQHHAFSSGGMGPASLASRVMDDFELAPAPGRIEESYPMPRPNGWGWLEPLAGAVALAGAVSCGFFAYKLWPEIKRIDTKHLSARIDSTVQDTIAWYKTNYVDTMVIVDSSTDETVTDFVSGAADKVAEAVKQPSPVISLHSSSELPSAPMKMVPARPMVPAAPVMSDQVEAPRALPPIPAGAVSLPAADLKGPDLEAPSRVAHQEPTLPPQ